MNTSITSRRSTARIRDPGLARRGWLVLWLGAVLAPAGARARAPAGEVIDRFCASLIQLMKLGKTTPFARRSAVIAPQIDEVFDLGTILRVSVGPSWTGLSNEERAGLLATYRHYSIATYVANFAGYDGERFDVSDNARTVGKDVVVQTRLIRPGASPVSIDYAMRSDGTRWRAIDVLLDGAISRVAVQRSDFRSLIADGGIAALASSLIRKTADLEGK